MKGFTGCCVTVAIASITWTEVKPIAFPFSDFLLLVATVPVLVRLTRERELGRLPKACVIGIMGVALAVLLNAIFPVSQLYYEARYSGDTGIPPIAVPSELVRVLSSLEVGIKLLVGMLVMPLAIMAVAPDRARMRTLFDLWCGSALVNAGVALLDATHLTHINAYLFGTTSSTVGREAGLTNHPDHLATVLVMAIPIAFSWWQRDPVWRRRGMIAVAALILALYSTGSRGGLAAGAVILIVGTFSQPAVRRRIIPVVVPLAFVFVAVLVLDGHLAHALLQHTRFKSGAASGSDTARKEVARQAILDIKHRPSLGVGFDVADQGHSIYLQAIASGGVLTLVSLVVYVSGVLTGVRLRVKDYWTPSVIAAVVSILGWMTLGVVDNDFADRYPYVPMAMLLAIAVVRARERSQAADAATRRPAVSPPAQLSPVPG